MATPPEDVQDNPNPSTEKTAELSFADQAVSEQAAENLKQFKKRRKSLELTIHNKTTAELMLVDEYFFTGEWYEHFSSTIIEPQAHSKALVANKPGLLTGVTGGLMFKMILKDNPPKYLIIGFTSPSIGTYKTYISLSNDELTARNGYDNAKNNHHKLHFVENFKLEATILAPCDGGKKQLVFRISEKNQ